MHSSINKAIIMPQTTQEQRFVLAVLKQCHFNGLNPHSLGTLVPAVYIHVSGGTRGKQMQWVNLSVFTDGNFFRGSLGEN